MTMEQQMRKSSLVRQPNMVESGNLYELFKSAGANVDQERSNGGFNNRETSRLGLGRF